MFRIAEYRKRPRTLADHLPYAGFIDDGVLMNKDAAFQTTLRYRGMDVDSTTPRELITLRAQINNALARAGTGYCFHFEAMRNEVRDFPESTFSRPVPRLVDRERRANLLGEGRCYDTDYYLTVMYLPPEEHIGWARELFIDADKSGDATQYRRHYEKFKEKVETIGGLLKQILPHVEPLNTEETLTYLHACVSNRHFPVKAPEVPFYIDTLITDTPYYGGLSPRLGDLYLKTVTVVQYALTSVPAMFDGLNQLPFAYRWSNRWIPLDQKDSAALMNKRRRHWQSKEKDVRAIIHELATKQESRLKNSDALNKAQDAGAALEELGDGLTYGLMTLAITVSDTDEQVAMERAKAVQQVLDGARMTSQIERTNATESWLGSLPGHAYANIRRDQVSTLNLIDMMPLHAPWVGPRQSPHLGGPPLMCTRTEGSTVFWFDLYDHGVGHTVIFGPTGTGKSVLLNAIAIQFDRYPNSMVHIFDRGGSCRALTLSVGGDYYDLGARRKESENTATLAFQPLADIDQPSEKQWAHEWLIERVEEEGLSVTPEIKEALWTALGTLEQNDRSQRTMSVFVGLLQDASAKTALRPLTLAGPYGYLFDASSDGLRAGRFQAFETEQLIGTKAAAAAITYICHRLDGQFISGHPGLLVFDEAWLMLTHPLFVNRLRGWLKELRKKNIAVIFATQNISDVRDSPIASTVFENCPTRLFLPNDKATNEEVRELYERFGLNQTQIELIATAIPQRDYYFQAARGNRLFELDLSGMELAILGASAPQDHALMDKILAEHGESDFAFHWLCEKGLHAAAERLETLTTGELNECIAATA